MEASDEMIAEAARSAYHDPVPDTVIGAFHRGAKWHRDFSAPMPTCIHGRDREHYDPGSHQPWCPGPLSMPTLKQIIEAKRDKYAVLVREEGDQWSWVRDDFDAVLALYGKSEARPCEEQPFTHRCPKCDWMFT